FRGLFQFCILYFGRYDWLGWSDEQLRAVRFRPVDEVQVTPAQRAVVWFLFVSSLLFVLQTLTGGLIAHYRAEPGAFFGIDFSAILPFNIMRTWHVQLAMFWVSASYLATGIWTPGLGIPGSRQLWQILLIVGLFLWVFILVRGLSGTLREQHFGNMPWMLFYAALAIPAFYAVGLLASPHEAFVVNDFWRFWVVHLWVEDFLELFTTVIVAYMFVLLGRRGKQIILSSYSSPHPARCILC
ncbi:MAG TPA: hypothetical protein VFU31_20705, partial [Candidatus Binatia bacterium]|nr:hypothetical protein [Candidatus Binatia bacterium]